MIHWDQLFGVLSAAVRFVDLICDPADLVVTFGCASEWPHFSFMWTPVASFDFRKMKSILERIDIRKWIGERAQIKVTYLTACRDWTKWFLVSPPLFSQNVPASVMPYLQPVTCPRLNTNLPVTFQGGLKTDETGNHAFLFMRRRGQENWLSSSMLSPSSFWIQFPHVWMSPPWDLPPNVMVTYDQSIGRIIPHELDVVCLVKRNAADTMLSQESGLSDCSGTSYILWWGHVCPRTVFAVSFALASYQFSTSVCPCYIQGSGSGFAISVCCTDHDHCCDRATAIEESSKWQSEKIPWSLPSLNAKISHGYFRKICRISFRSCEQYRARGSTSSPLDFNCITSRCSSSGTPTIGWETCPCCQFRSPFRAQVIKMRLLWDLCNTRAVGRVASLQCFKNSVSHQRPFLPQVSCRNPCC